MNDELFAELMDSVREGGAILRGEKEPSRRFEIATPDVKQIRKLMICHRASLPLWYRSRRLYAKMAI